MITELEEFDLKHHNTFRIPATTDVWIEYTSAKDLPAMAAGISGRKHLAIGSGSNMLFTGHFNGVILHSRILDAETHMVDSNHMLLRAGSGIELDSLVEQTCRNGLWGLENLSGIPGSVGASAVQNVGAYGVEAKDVIHNIECYDMLTGNFVSFIPDKCDYGYRHSIFKTPEVKGRYIVTYVTYRLSVNPVPHLDYGNLASRAGNDPTPYGIREAVMSLRASKLPSVDEYGSAGSFFKNPVISPAEYSTLCERVSQIYGENTPIPHFTTDHGIKVPAAWLIDKCGLKGYRSGGAAVWHLQPLVIVNLTGKCTAGDVLSVENHIVKSVREKFGIDLSPEVEHI